VLAGEDLQLHPARAGVLGDVRQRLLHQPVDDGFELRLQSPGIDPKVGCHLDLGSLTDPLGQVLESGDEAELVERGGPQLGD
jgi:hypothetical protein